MEQPPRNKPQRRPLTTICRKCGHPLNGDYLEGIKEPIRTVCPGCMTVTEHPEVADKAHKREMAIGKKSATLRGKKSTGKK